VQPQAAAECARPRWYGEFGIFRGETGEAVKWTSCKSANGEKIYDVTASFADEPCPHLPAACGMSSYSATGRSCRTAEKVAWQTRATTIGALPRASIPGHGSVLHVGHRCPDFTKLPLHNREKLTFQLDHEHVEIKLQKNVFEQTASHVVWVIETRRHFLRRRPQGPWQYNRR